MSQSIILGCKGWMTDPNVMTTGQAGALKTARNIMVRLPNTIEPRPGFNVDSSFTNTSQTNIRSLHEWGSKYISCSRTSYGTYSIRYNDNVAITGVGVASGAYPFDDAYGYHHSFVARKNFYLCGTDAGVCKLASSSDTVAQTTIAEPTLSLYSTTSSATIGVISATSAVAYRAVVRRKDANNYITRSAPSNYYRIYNPAATAIYPDYLVVCLPPQIEAGDYVEIYKSLNISGDNVPADEMFLASETIVDAGNVSAGYMVITESTPEYQLGAALYTNASQQGIAKANNPPPAAGCSAVWNSCAWYGNTASKPTVILKLRKTDGTFGDGIPYFGVHSTTVPAGIAGAGLSTFTIAASASNDVYVGQAVSDGTSWGPDSAFMTTFTEETLVTAYNNTTGVVTISKPTKGAMGAGGTVRFCDSVLIGAHTYYAYVSGLPGVLSKSFDATVTATGQETDEELVGRNLSLAAAYYGGAAANGGYTVTAIESADNASASIIIRRGEGFSGLAFGCSQTSTRVWGSDTPVAWNSGAGTTYDVEYHYNRVYYSKPDEPEAVPELNYFQIGREDQRVLALVPLRDALLVFKQDGIWRISGSAPDNWRVDQVAEDGLVSSRAVTSLDQTAYAWTNKGIISVTAYGDAQSVDGQIHDEINSVYLNNYSSILASSDSLMSQIHAVTHDRLNLVLFQLPAISSVGAFNPQPPPSGGYDNPSSPPASDSFSEGTTKFVLCYAPGTDAWSQWDMRADATTASMFHRANGLLYFARGGTSQVRVERTGTSQGDGEQSYDGSHTISVTSPSGLLATVVPGSTTYEPMVGDFLFQDGTYYRIDAVLTTAIVQLDKTGMTAAACTAYEGVRAVIEWQPAYPGQLQMGGRWYEMGVHMDGVYAYSSDQAFVLKCGGTTEDIIGSYRQTTNAQLPSSAVSLSGNPNPVVRVWLPRSLNRAGKLTPYVEVNSFQVYWKIVGLTLIQKATSEKLRRNF